MTPGAPASLLPSLRGVAFVCPRCGGDLEVFADGYFCAPCRARYPLLAGIPDFRVFADPNLSAEEDRDRTGKILEAMDSLPFPALLEYYWSLSDITPPALSRRFVASALRGKDRARRLLSLVERSERPPLETVLEVGSGSGNFLAAAAGVFPRVVATDIAMRWLHLSRRRMRDEGLPEPALVCCCAEALPFPGGSFDGAFSIGTLEFLRDPGRFFTECERVLVPGGSLFVATANRFSIAPQPHAALWGVGYLPRRWQARYVRWRRKASFENVRLLSRREIDRLAAGFSRREFALPEIGPGEVRALPLPLRLAAGLYGRIRRRRGLAKPLAAIVPEWNIRLRKRIK